jgi:hypothetical protein
MNADTSSQMVQAFKLTHLLGTFPLHRYLRAWPGALYVGQKGRCVSHQVAPAMWMYFVKRMEDGKILLVSAIKRRWGIKSLYAERRDYFFSPAAIPYPTTSTSALTGTLRRVVVAYLGHQLQAVYDECTHGIHLARLPFSHILCAGCACADGFQSNQSCEWKHVVVTVVNTKHIGN